ncbi:unnamed protein product, partial [Amoebophrya sp. A120]
KKSTYDHVQPSLLSVLRTNPSHRPELPTVCPPYCRAPQVSILKAAKPVALPPDVRSRLYRGRPVTVADCTCISCATKSFSDFKKKRRAGRKHLQRELDYCSKTATVCASTGQLLQQATPILPSQTSSFEISPVGHDQGVPMRQAGKIYRQVA